jgi:predicted dehydrogenase
VSTLHCVSNTTHTGRRIDIAGSTFRFCGIQVESDRVVSTLDRVHRRSLATAGALMSNAHAENAMQDSTDDAQVAAGVIGVGSMGQHHARIYSELPETSLVGVHDLDDVQAARTASKHRTRAMGREELLEAVDVVSVAVPTPHHYEAVAECIESGVDTLVEKPFVDDLAKGRELANAAREADVTLQVGHIERFNPATQVLTEIVPDLDVVAVDIDRLGPPLERDNEDNVVMDLMIHDVDIVLSLLDAEIDSLSAVAHDDHYVTAQFKFDDDATATLTASRLTQEKVRQLSITAVSCRVNVDFIRQSVEIHRRSLPEYVEADGDIRYRHESVVERPMVENGEPLKAELSSFVEAVQTGREPVVTAADALEVLTVLRRIETDALAPNTEVALP